MLPEEGLGEPVTWEGSWVSSQFRGKHKNASVEPSGDWNLRGSAV